MGELAFHEEIMRLEDGRAIHLRQVYGESDAYIGIGDADDADVLVRLTADEVDALHAAIEQLRWARCERCDAPVDGSEGAPDEELLCEDCADEETAHA